MTSVYLNKEQLEILEDLCYNALPQIDEDIEQNEGILSQETINKLLRRKAVAEKLLNTFGEKKIKINEKELKKD